MNLIQSRFKQDALPIIDIVGNVKHTDTKSNLVLVYPYIKSTKGGDYELVDKEILIPADITAPLTETSLFDTYIDLIADVQ